MELIARRLRLVRQLVGSNSWFTLFVLAVLATLELAGKQYATTDWHDVPAAAVLGALLVIVAFQHNRTPLWWLQSVGRALRVAGEWFKQWLVEVGYDLRGDPPVRRGVPPIVFGIFGLLLFWGALLLAFGDFFPHALREFGVTYFYVGYLLMMSLVWGTTLLGIGISFYFAWGLIHDELAADDRGPRVSRGAVALGMLGAMLLANVFVPLWQVLTLCLLAWAALMIISFAGNSGDVRFLWRPRGSTQVRSISAPGSAAIIIGTGTLIALNLVITTSGSLVWKDRAIAMLTMPLTVRLGTVLGWVLLALLGVFVWQALKERLRSPARSSRRVLHVRGRLSPSARRALRGHFPRRRWRLEFAPHDPDACAATIELVEPTRSEAREFDPCWPLKVSLDDLDDADIRERIVRRSDIQIRRRLIAGLERVFKVAKRRKYRNGHGFWVAPHLSLWNGLRRDEPEPDAAAPDAHMVHDNIGPAYHSAIPHLARHLAHTMLRGLQIDLIFVEDGVTFRRFAKVMRRIFELHDKQPGRPAEDLHFVGLTGTRAIVYEFQFDNPFESETYPEPKFTTLGRARILLVFRDRSESEELVEPPFDTSRTPAPMGSSR